ncbi:hypothetical protein [Actinomadura violacea]|uniref:Uncharacterized protein n=1 Tax=Actinomadura violacea TaxID=2819934 RepID=A0ABS3RY29_9ACTN|nr:hypothetical protein [Actinomadura violacea]MBO2461612.1 hypothetical protein [Actinomadura violacea]
MYPDRTLRDLLKRAAAGHCFDEPFGTFICLDSAARLYGAVADDLDDGNCCAPGAAPGSAGHDPGKLPVVLESSDGDTATLNVGGLRFNVELQIGGGPDTVCMLCTAAGCPNPALTRTRLARYCENHLGHVDEVAMDVLGIPLAGDDRAPDWEEQAARDIREQRLDAWEHATVATVDVLKGRVLHRINRHRARAGK